MHHHDPLDLATDMSRTNSTVPGHPILYRPKLFNSHTNNESALAVNESLYANIVTSSLPELTHNSLSPESKQFHLKYSVHTRYGQVHVCRTPSHEYGDSSPPPPPPLLLPSTELTISSALGSFRFLSGWYLRASCICKVNIHMTTITIWQMLAG